MEAQGQNLGHSEAQGMFSMLVDEELPRQDEEKLLDHLGDCDDCKVSLEKYARAVTLVRKVGREKAPFDFSQQVLKRVRRRRRNAMFGMQGGRIFEHLNIPAEATVAVILAAVVAAAIIFSLP